MLAERDVTVDDAFLQAPSTGQPFLRVAAAEPSVRSTRWVRPVADVACTVSAALVVEGPTGVALAFVTLALLGLAFDWNRPVPLSATAPDELRTISVRVALPALVLLPFSPSAPLTWLAVAVAVAVVVGRWSTYALVRLGRRSGRVVEPVLLLGGGDHVLALRADIWSHPELGLEPILGSSLSLRAGDDLATFVGTADIDRCVREEGVRRVVIAGGSGYDAEIVSTVRAARSYFDLLYLPGPQQPVVGPHVVGDEIVAGRAAQRLAGGPNRLGAHLTKRAVDVVGAAILLAVLAPVLLAAAVAVRLSSPGPILFRQARVGRDGKVFHMLKFRSFPVEHKDVELALSLDQCPLAVGRFLRRTSIDELPQLFNVIRGEMSLVGPRPERPHFAEPLAAKIPEYDARHRVSGGLTGLAQVNGYWGLSEIESRVRLDNHYIDTWSVWRDLGILLRTIPAIVVKSLA